MASAAAVIRSAPVGRRRRFSPKNFASTSATAILANSEGCRLKKPQAESSGARLPRTTPKNST